jgi:uncharacterized RDD family membrane protein YckC
MPNNQWFYARNNQQIGPVELTALRDLLARGAVSPGDLVWTEGMPEWKPAGTVPELSMPQAVAPPPPVVGQPGGYPGAPMAGYPASGYPQGGQGGFPQAGMPHGLNYQTPQYGIPYAGFWLRFVAYIIDAIILAIPTMIIAGILGASMFMSHAAYYSGGGSYQPVMTPMDGVIRLVELILGWLYYGLMESSNSQATLGKMALGIKVTNLQGGKMSFGQASGRYIGMIVSGLICCIGFMMAGWTSQKQALHDMMAGTLVVRK